MLQVRANQSYASIVDINESPSKRLVWFLFLSFDGRSEVDVLFVASARGTTDDVELRGSPFLLAKAITLGFIAILLLALLVLYIPTKRSANSNILLRSEIIMNCAFFVRSLM
mmetsp:Transcript_13710/g.32107  ORF Transcript_13710/g.32107 Transcript_13710/m.32107 type:complete len:112 (-) Transcript_13710:3900-4235(-)